MNVFVLKKWVQPYVLLQFFNDNFCADSLTFDGSDKIPKKEKFLETLLNDKSSIGLYMKNVNKFYIFSQVNSCLNISDKLIETLNLSSDDYAFSEDFNSSLALVDIAKAEAVVILP